MIMIEKEGVPASCRRGYAQIDLQAVLQNAMALKENLSEHTKMLAVVKSNGYGHGSIPVAKTLEPLDFMHGFAVATFEEACALRDAGIRKPILILGFTAPYCYRQMAEMDIHSTLFREDVLDQLEEAALAVNKTLKVHIKVDTGMSRIGITPDEAGLAFIGSVLEKKGIEIEGIFTHFANADEADKQKANDQLALFKNFVETVESRFGIQIPMKHCSNSAAAMDMKQAHMDAVRAGIALYGIAPSDEIVNQEIHLQPALSLCSEVVYTKTVQTGTPVSYGSTFTAPVDMRLATVSIGYGDGYPRSLSNCGYVLIRGKKAPIVGRVCMDQFMVDVSEIPSVCEGDKVTLIGRDGEEEITTTELGSLSGRFHYELLCDISERIPRVYTHGGI